LDRLGIHPYRPLDADVQPSARAAAYSGTGGRAAGTPQRKPGPVGPAPDQPDFSKMTQAEKVAWNLQRWKRILG
jgi:hypothetical protein